MIIGREKELVIFNESLSSDMAEFIAVYGRRRVGKTYLIKHFFSAQNGIFFELTGINDCKVSLQLKNFSEALSLAFYGGVKLAVPKSWIAAIKQLTEAIDRTPKNKRIFLFFDELPWLASHKSGFLSALEYFWNTKWTYRKKLILIVCGSAASWMLENIVYAKGGLHNRITVHISLQPFNLREVALYLKQKKIELSHQQTLEYYMVMGGVPHYLSKIKKNMSVSQNINALCFQKDGPLYSEFNQLFHSLYDDPDAYINIIRTIAKKSAGVGRDDVLQTINAVTTGGRLSDKLRNLEEAGFIRKFIPFKHKRKGVHYKIIDEYILFYLNWIEPYRAKTNLSSINNYWTTVNRTAPWYAWSGYAFEAVCLKHIDSIKMAMKFDQIFSYCGEWRYLSKLGDGGAQIDLVFDRDDDCVVLCEIKHTDRKFTLTKDYARELESKKLIYLQQTETMKQIFWCLITNNNVTRNQHYSKLITHNVTISDFF